MGDDAKQAWSEVGEKFSSWGRRVAARYRESAPGDAASSEEAEREIKRAAKELVDELGRGATALGETFRDKEASQELSRAVSAIGDAITATVNETVESIRSGRDTGQGPSTSPDDSPGGSA